MQWVSNACSGVSNAHSEVSNAHSGGANSAFLRSPQFTSVWVSREACSPVSSVWASALLPRKADVPTGFSGFQLMSCSPGLIAWPWGRRGLTHRNDVLANPEHWPPRETKAPAVESANVCGVRLPTTAKVQLPTRWHSARGRRDTGRIGSHTPGQVGSAHHPRRRGVRS